MNSSRLSFALFPTLLGVAGAVLLAGCQTPEQSFALGVAATTVLGARTPTQEIEQIYYLGVFDPREQVPPAVYRVRVHGQASILSGMKFGSGWVHASLVDSLGTSFHYDTEDKHVTITRDANDKLASLQPGRRLVLFGPEGFREAPKDHRLVIVMGASPEKFFQAVDNSLSLVSKVMAEQRNEGIDKRILEILTKAKAERDKLAQLEKDVDEATKTKGDAK